MAIFNLKESQLHARESDELQVAMQQEIAMSRNTLNAQNEDITRLISEKTQLQEQVTMATDERAVAQTELLAAQEKVASLLKKLAKKGGSHGETKNPA